MFYGGGELEIWQLQIYLIIWSGIDNQIIWGLWMGNVLRFCSVNNILLTYTQSLQHKSLKPSILRRFRCYWNILTFENSFSLEDSNIIFLISSDVSWASCILKVTQQQKIQFFSTCVSSPGQCVCIPDFSWNFNVNSKKQRKKYVSA